MKRRLFVKTAAGAGGLLLVGAPPALAQPKTITLKIESPVPVSSVLFENFKMFAERVEKMSGGRLKIETLPAGAIVGAFEILDAASRGLLDGGHYWVGYATGKGPAAALLAGAPAGTWGMDHLDYYGWIYEGGGLALFQEFYDHIKANVVTVGPVAGVGPQMLGWFKKPIKDLAEFKRMKYRVPGIASDVYQELGVSVVNLAGGEIREYTKMLAESREQAIDRMGEEAASMGANERLFAYQRELQFRLTDKRKPTGFIF